MKTKILSFALIVALLMATTVDAGRTKKTLADKSEQVKEQVKIVISSTPIDEQEVTINPRFRVVNTQLTQVVRSANYQLARRVFAPIVIAGSSAGFEVTGTGGETATGGGSSEQYAAALGFWPDYSTGGCCGEFTSGLSGDTDCDGEGKRNLADITRLIDNVYISKLPLCCPENGNVDGDVEGKANLADITSLIDHVYISKTETSTCQ